MGAEESEEVIYYVVGYVQVVTSKEIKPRLRDAQASTARIKLAKEIFAKYKLTKAKK